MYLMGKGNMDVIWAHILFALALSAATIATTVEPYVTPVIFNVTPCRTNARRCMEHIRARVFMGEVAVTLTLELNTRMNSQVAQHDDVTDDHIFSQQNQLRRHVCGYQGVSLPAAISVACQTTSTHMEGTFDHNGTSYRISPLYASSVRMRRSASARMLHNGHLIYERRTSPVFSSGKRLRGRRSAISYEVELFVVIDYSLYSRFLSVYSSTATEEIIKYYAAIIHEADNRFVSILSGDYGMSLVLVGFHIATTSGDSPWTEDNMVSGQPDMVDAINALEDFTDWALQHTDSPDHYMLFTAYNLYYDQANVTGLAFKGTICTDTSTSVITDKGLYLGATVVAHELGHSLSMAHDGDAESGTSACPAEDLYIMTAMVEDNSQNLELSVFNENSLAFSSCSIQTLTSKINELNVAGSNCLVNDGSVWDAAIWSSVVSQQSGQLYTLDTQCKLVYGTDSLFCGVQSVAESICQSMRCYDADSGQCLIQYSTPALPFTTCADKKWCIGLECVSSEEAPEANGDCVFGDYPLPVGGIYCNEYVTSTPYTCYSQANRELCCDSCAAIYDVTSPDCEYGDKAAWCEGLDMADCYLNADVCCQRCAQLSSGIPGCEWGDEAGGCTELSCGLAANVQLCCDTCSSAFTTTTSSSSGQTPSSTPDTKPHSTAWRHALIFIELLYLLS